MLRELAGGVAREEAYANAPSDAVGSSSCVSSLHTMCSVVAGYECVAMMRTGIESY